MKRKSKLFRSCAAAFLGNMRFGERILFDEIRKVRHYIFLDWKCNAAFILSNDLSEREDSYFKTAFPN